MGLRGKLDKGAPQRAAMLRPLMLPDEEIVVYDIATLDTNPRVRMDFVATQRALYLVDSETRRPSRFPYEEVASVLWGGTTPGFGGRFWVSLHDGRQIPSTMKRGDLGLGAYVKERVDAQVVFSRRVEREPGRGARFDYRRFSEGGVYGWNVAPDEGLDLDDPGWDAWARQTMVAMKQEADAVAVDPGSVGAFHAGWKDDGTGAMFVPKGDGGFICRLDDPDNDDLITHMLMEAAWDELAAAHGQLPLFGGGRVSFMPITWHPALPTSAP